MLLAQVDARTHHLPPPAAARAPPPPTSRTRPVLRTRLRVSSRARRSRAQVLTLLVYMTALVALSSPALLDATFDLQFILTVEFAWRVALLTAVSTVPVWIVKIGCQCLAPRVATKLS